MTSTPRPTTLYNRGAALADRKPFLLRTDPKLLAALQRWADEDLRSLNAQIEFLLRRVLVDAGRLKRDTEGGGGRRRR